MSSGRRCVVIGAGLLGLSAAWSLSRRGWSVDVLEAADGIGHPLAGSKGDARIFRLGYPDPLYVGMAIAARSQWRELEERSGRRLLSSTGQLNFGDPAALEGVAGALTRLGEPAEALAVGEIEERFPGVVAPGPALFEPQSGVLAADECLLALREAGRFDVHTRARVIRLEDRGEGVVVHSAGAAPLGADVAVDCAGPNALRLVGSRRQQQVGTAPSLPQIAYFRGKAKARADDPSRLPIFIEWGDAMVYGLPVFGSGSHAGTFKVSHHTPGPTLRDYDPAGASMPMLGTDDPALLRTLTDAVGRLLPGLDPEPVATERCLYDNSADGDFVLDRVGNVVVGCGTSGHGFKFGPLFGEILADLADGTVPQMDLGPFRIARPHGIDRPGPRLPDHTESTAR